jgi:hypothetical protein
VSGSAETTYRIWRRDKTNGTRKRLVATAYGIDHDGTLHDLFPAEAWAYQFGLAWSTAQRLQFERRFIGIDIVSEGALAEQDGELYCYDRVSPRTMKSRHEAFDYGAAYRGYRSFDRYAPPQLESLGERYGRFRAA